MCQSESLEKCREVRSLTSGQQIFTERLSEPVPYHLELQVRQIALAHTDGLCEFKSGQS